MKTESELQQQIQLEAPKHGSILERNNSGAFTDITGRNIRFGLGNISAKHSDNMKSSDLIGITTIIITPSMIGKKVGIFTAIEVKKEDWKSTKNLDKRETAQKNYMDWILSKGGIAGFCNSLESFRELLKR